MILIGLTGKARSGKDTVAEFLAADLRFHHDSLAKPLKQAASAIFHLSHDQLYGGAKEKLDHFWGMSPREIMQRFGTDAFRREFGKDVWTKSLERRISGLERVVISDVRFDDGAAWVRRRGGFVWEIVRPGAPAVRKHVSEQGVGLVDCIVMNDGSVLELFDKVRNLLRSTSGGYAPRGHKDDLIEVQNG